MIPPPLLLLFPDPALSSHTVTCDFIFFSLGYERYLEMVSMGDSKWGLCSTGGLVVVSISFPVSFDNLVIGERGTSDEQMNQLDWHCH